MLEDSRAVAELQGIRRRAWAEVELDAIRYNYRTVRRHIPEDTKVCCVIKGDAYGHGAVKLAALYERLGADWFAVSNIEEALQLRSNGITLPILILGFTPEECAETLAEQNISQCVYSYEYGMRLADFASNAGVKVKIHVNLDTGMGRIGFLSREVSHNEWKDALAVCRCHSLIPEGVFTHCAVADQGTDGAVFTHRQFEIFMDGVRYLEEHGVRFSLRHFANSAVIFDYPDFHLDMVRAGIVLYGLSPSDRIKALPTLRPAMTWKSVISHVKQLKIGESIGYGRSFTANREMTVATVPVGYADGFWRQNQSKNGYLTLNDKKAPIVGRVCMDQLMLDVTDLSCHVNDVVTLFGNGGREAEELARENGTIGYEILCDVGTRVPRIYLDNGSWQGCLDYIYSKDLS